MPPPDVRGDDDGDDVRENGRQCRAVEQGERNTQHLLEGSLRDALAGLVVSLGAIGQIHRLQALRDQGVRIRGATAGDAQRLMATGPQRGLGCAHRRGARRQAIPREHPLHRNVGVAVAVGHVGGLMDAVHDLGRHGLSPLLAEAPHLGDERAVIGYDVHRGASGDRPDVHRRLLVNSADAHRGDGPSGRQDRAASQLGANAGVRRDPAEGRLQAEMRGRGHDHLPDRRGVVEDIPEVAA